MSDATRKTSAVGDRQSARAPFLKRPSTGDLTFENVEVASPRRSGVENGIACECRRACKDRTTRGKGQNDRAGGAARTHREGQRSEARRDARDGRDLGVVEDGDVAQVVRSCLSGPG